VSIALRYLGEKFRLQEKARQPLHMRILIWKIVVGRMTSEVVENTDELSFGEAQRRKSGVTVIF